MSKLLAVRIPEDLIGELHNLRKLRGTVISHFVTEAITEKMAEMKEETADIALITARKHESSVSEKEWNKRLKHKGISV
ncbi:MAG: hypothetical protein A2044_08780 [Candidatus Firestonebacteria bacterium GWA2_43_8]|nr:MAG: hypothetical protein A2044_08780 [Candidatus Firestonebacteria bacterium GWA2_43_8]